MARDWPLLEFTHLKVIKWPHWWLGRNSLGDNKGKWVILVVGRCLVCYRTSESHKGVEGGSENHLLF